MKIERTPRSEINKEEQIEITESREVLSRKLEEYKRRLETADVSLYEDLDPKHKISVLEYLLKKGKIGIEDTREHVEKMLGKDYEEMLFKNAWEVMQDYVQTGGRGLVDGTGLPIKETEFD